MVDYLKEILEFIKDSSLDDKIKKKYIFVLETNIEILTKIKGEVSENEF